MLVLLAKKRKEKKDLTAASGIHPLGITTACLAWESCRRGMNHHIPSRCIVRGGLQHLCVATCGTPMLSTLTLIFRPINSNPIIHFCSDGSTDTKNKWSSRCLMSIIIISAICHRFLKHRHHLPGPTSDRPGVEPKTMFAADKPRLLTFSLFIICSFIFCCLPFFSQSFSSLPFLQYTPSHHHHHQTHTHTLQSPMPGSLSCPQPPPESCSLDCVEPESGKVSLWKQGKRQWRALYGREGKETEAKGEIKTRSWALLGNAWAVIRCRAGKKLGWKQFHWPVGSGNTQLWALNTPEVPFSSLLVLLSPFY